MEESHVGKGYEDRFLSEHEIREILDSALASARLNGKRVLIIIPDSTRTAPIPQMFRLFYEALGKEVAALDYLIALGTHKPMDQEAIDRLVGITPAERQGKYLGVRVFNHRWDLPETFVTVGQITPNEIEELTGGLMRQAVDVRLNRWSSTTTRSSSAGLPSLTRSSGFREATSISFLGLAAIRSSTSRIGSVPSSRATR
jgi:hypothetical protein